MTGRTIQQYELLEKLGAGGMGEIYKARDQRLNRFVAIKVLPAAMSGDANRRLRFTQEAQAASALNHPNIIIIYDILTENDTQYMVAEFIDGKTLLELIPKDGLRAPLAIQYACQMAEALCAAHGAGIIHRDLKPANVMVSSTGLVKLLDFGLAKALEQEAAAGNGSATATMMQPGLTVEGTLLGTVNYMSPEQAEGRRLDARSDIFSFGTVLYEMLTGRSAFQRSSVVATLSAILRDDAPRVAELAPDVPGDLEVVVARCLQKDPDQRYQSMQEVRGALTALKRQSDSGALYNRAAMAVPPPQRKRSAAPAMVGVLVLAAVAAGGFWWMTHRSTDGRPAETRAESPVPSVPSHNSTLTNDNIVTMVTAKVDPSVIVGQIRSTQTNFDMSAPAVIELSKAGVPANVIEAMRNPQVAVVPPSASGNPGSGNAAQIVVKDGLLVHLTLADDIPATATEGSALSFRVAADVRASGALVIRKGAAASGSVVDGAKKKFISLGGKMMFRLDSVDAADGQKLSIRATASAPKNGISKHGVEGGKSKDVASAAGTEYTGYVDGAQPVARSR
jgi:serine/threonine-protein kinase